MNLDSLTTCTTEYNERLLFLIEKQTEYITVNSSDNRLVASVNWLLKQQLDNGSWGKESIAVSAISLLCLREISGMLPDGNLKSQVVDVQEKGEGYIANVYSSDKFENAPWDVAVSIRVLSRSPQKYRNLLERLSSWLVSYLLEKPNVGPHHYAQAIIALRESGARKERVSGLVQLLTEMVTDKYQHYSPYVLAQCFEALSPEDCFAIYEKMQTQLELYLKNAHLDSANFINICACLSALKKSLDSEAMHELKISLASLFGNTCFRENGTWYYDVMSTSWALWTLSNLTKEVVIRVPKSEFKFEVAMLQDNFKEKAVVIRKKEIREEIKFSILFLLSVLSILCLLYFTKLEEYQLDETLFWGITGVIGVASTYVLKHYTQRIQILFEHKK